MWLIEDQKLSIQNYNTNERKVLEKRKMVKIIIIELIIIIF